MNIENYFKTLIYSEYVFMFLGMVIALVHPGSSLPSLDYSQYYFWEVLLLILAVIYFINLYFLLNYKDISRRLFMVITIIFISSYFLLPTEYLKFTRIEILIDSIALLVSGGIFSLIYFSEIKKKFT